MSGPHSPPTFWSTSRTHNNLNLAGSFYTREPCWHNPQSTQATEQAGTPLPPTTMPRFGKFTLGHFAFTKDIHPHLYSLTKRNPKRFSLLQGKAKRGNSAQRLFCKEQVTEAVSTPEVRGSLPHSSLGPVLSISEASHQAFTQVWKHLGFISIYWVHPIARCVWRSLLPESFHRNTLLSDSRETCIGFFDVCVCESVCVKRRPQPVGSRTGWVYLRNDDGFIFTIQTLSSLLGWQTSLILKTATYRNKQRTPWQRSRVFLWEGCKQDHRELEKVLSGGKKRCQGGGGKQKSS